MRKGRLLETALWVAFAGCAGYCAFCLFQAEGVHFVTPVDAQQSASETDGAIVGRMREGNTYAPGIEVADGAILGQLTIPALRLSVPVVEGVTKRDLLRGIGHVPGSAVAGGLGNMALAAHRDTYFRPLRNIKPGMELLIRSQSGTYSYQVDTTEIVTPEQVSVLEIGSVPEATLITCYPFDFIGAAPKRFIVHSHLKSLIPVTH